LINKCGSRVSRKAEKLFYKFIEQLELTFNNPPIPLKWLSFLLNNLVLLTSIPFTVQRVSLKHGLNKAQIKALLALESIILTAFT